MRERATPSPPSTADGGPRDDAVARVAALIVSLQRTLKSFRLYAADHPALEGSVAEFLAELEAILEDEEELRLRVSEGRIAWNGETVYENPDREEGLALRLFIHGVREITFHRGVPVAEVFGLAQVLHHTLRTRSAVDDLLSLLWEKDFSFITFVVLEDFLEDADQTEYDRFLEEGRRSEQAPASLRATLRPVLDRLLAQTPSESGGLPGLLHIDEGEKDRLATLVAEEESRDLARGLARIAVAVAEKTPDPDLEPVRAIVSRALLSFLTEGAFAQAAGIAAELEEVRDGKPDGRMEEFARRVLDEVDAERLLSAVRPYLVCARPEDLDRLSVVLGAIGRSADFVLGNLLDQESTRVAAVELLKRGGENHLPLLASRLAEAPPALATALLDAAAAIGGPEILPVLAGPLRHPDPTVRREAFRALRRVGTEAAFAHLRDALLGPDPEMRLFALGALEGLPPACYRDTLLRIAESPDFASREYFERREVLLSLGRAKDRTSEDFLLRCARKRSLFRPHASAELRACAVAALALRGSERATEAVSRALADPSPIVRRAAAAARGGTTTAPQ